MKRIKTNCYFPDGEQLYLYLSLSGLMTAKRYNLFVITDQGKVLGKDYEMHRQTRLKFLIEEVNKSSCIIHDISKRRFISRIDTWKILVENMDAIVKEYAFLVKKVFYEYDTYRKVFYKPPEFDKSGVCTNEGR